VNELTGGAYKKLFRGAGIVLSFGHAQGFLEFRMLRRVDPLNYGLVEEVLDGKPEALLTCKINFKNLIGLRVHEKNPILQTIEEILVLGALRK